MAQVWTIQYKLSNAYVKFYGNVQGTPYNPAHSFGSQQSQQPPSHAGTIFLTWKKYINISLISFWCRFNNVGWNDQQRHHFGSDPNIHHGKKCYLYRLQIRFKQYKTFDNCSHVIFQDGSTHRVNIIMVRHNQAITVDFWKQFQKNIKYPSFSCLTL
jgi:hypothetical protein